MKYYYFPIILFTLLFCYSLNSLAENLSFRQRFITVLEKLEKEKAQSKNGIPINRYIEETEPLIKEAINEKNITAPDSDFNTILNESSGTSDVQNFIFSYALGQLIIMAEARNDDAFKSDCVSIVIDNVFSKIHIKNRLFLISNILFKINGQNIFSIQEKQKIKEFVISQNYESVSVLLLAERAGLFSDADFIRHLNEQSARCNDFNLSTRSEWAATVFLARHNDPKALEKVLKIAALRKFEKKDMQKECWRLNWMLYYLILIPKPEIVELLKEYLKSDMKNRLGEDTDTIYIARTAADVLSGLLTDFSDTPYRFDDKEIVENRAKWLNAIESKKSLSFKPEKFTKDYKTSAGRIYSWLFSEG